MVGFDRLATDPSNFEDSTARGLELELLLFREDMSDISTADYAIA